MKSILLLLICICAFHEGYSQTELKPVVGVAEFSSEVDSKYSSSVAEKVVQVVTNTRRFTVVDRTSYDKVKQELEFQKSEAFLDSKTNVKQDVALAAHHMIIGHIVKMNVYAMKNTDGTINGYKSSVAFTLKMNDVETGKTTESESFQTEVSPLMMSPESAVNEALNSIEPELVAYFSKTFPMKTSICKVLLTKKDAATSVLIVGGRTFGVKEGDKLRVQKSELIDGREYLADIGEIKVTVFAGDDFSECTVLSGGKEILVRFNGREKLICTLVVE